MSGTITGGVQTTNNVIGSGGINLEGYTDQTAVTGQYITATGLTATVRGRRVAYTITGQRGAAVAYSSSNRAFAAMLWNYKNDSSKKYVDSTWHKFDAAGSYQTSVKILNSIQTAGVTVQLASPVVVGDMFISTHDRSFCRTDMTEITEHDESFAGKI